MREKGGIELDIVCFSSTKWDFLWQRPQQLMSRMSGINRVLYVDHFQPVGSGGNFGYETEKRLRMINDSLFIFSPGYTTRQRLIQALDVLYTKIGFKRPILFAYYPSIVPILDKIEYCLLCYDCVDDFSQFSWNPSWHQGMERKLIDRCDVMFVTSRKLMELKRPLKQNIFLVPNGADVSHFAGSMDENLEVPSYMKGIKRPVIGFIGAIYEWVDTGLIMELCRLKQDWSFTMVGPIGRNAKLDDKYGNLFLLGKKEYDELPGIIKAFDVCIIPFKKSKLTESTNPVKLYEYLAAGKPVVSTPIPEVLDFQDTVMVGGNAREFIAAIEASLAEDSPELIRKRMIVAGENSWDKRVEAMQRIIEHQLSADA
ncbi:MAG: Glycosyl transferase, group 2 family protein [Firmicutes bacterium]|nr:Glycosyl transferase, group 2 family protein [Bacillota bacterium]MDI6705311.1 glycosyltransferase [Bacillota bacterium]